MILWATRTYNLSIVSICPVISGRCEEVWTSQLIYYAIYFLLYYIPLQRQSCFNAATFQYIDSFWPGLQRWKDDLSTHFPLQYSYVCGESFPLSWNIRASYWLNDAASGLLSYIYPSFNLAKCIYKSLSCIHKMTFSIFNNSWHIRVTYVWASKLSLCCMYWVSVGIWSKWNSENYTHYRLRFLTSIEQLPSAVVFGNQNMAVLHNMLFPNKKFLALNQTFSNFLNFHSFVS